MSEPDYLVITGNPVDGFMYIGPFRGAESAERYSDVADLECDWWIAPVTAPFADYPGYDEPRLTGHPPNPELEDA